MTSERRPLRVLCLDGGGIKGYTSLLILKRLFRELQSKDADRREVQPYEVFDLIVGTSTGGIIATMLGRLHMSIDDCLQQYQDIGKKVFGKRPSGGKVGKAFRGIFSSASTMSTSWSRRSRQSYCREAKCQSQRQPT